MAYRQRRGFMQGPIAAFRHAVRGAAWQARRVALLERGLWQVSDS